MGIATENGPLTTVYINVERHAILTLPLSNIPTPDSCAKLLPNSNRFSQTLHPLLRPRTSARH